MSNVKSKITFALYFGNRGFFPGEVIADAIDEMKKAVEQAGFSWICMDTDKTRYGAVETAKEGRIYADFLEQNRGNFDGVILCLPNFGDECGALAALKDANVPILVQAYPDEIGLMDFAHRRDAMCGKFAMCNILRQADIPFTLTEKFVVSPTSTDFKADLLRFAAVCRVVRGMKSFNVGAIGARTTAFKTVRVDEIALQKKGINVETIDLSDVFCAVDKVSEERVNEKKEQILSASSFNNLPLAKLDRIARTQAVFEDMVSDYNLQAVAIRCWDEFEKQMGITPCMCLGLLNDSGIPAACEVDITNAVMMYALSLASDSPSILLDYNNNYGQDENKAIMFHCGPVAPSLLEEKGEIIEHLMYKKTFGDGTGIGVNIGKMKSGNITFGSIKTENGKVSCFVTQGRFTDDEIEEGFFGCGKVVEKNGINNVANYMANNGYKHHLCITFGDWQNVIKEAFGKYLKYDIEVL